MRRAFCFEPRRQTHSDLSGVVPMLMRMLANERPPQFFKRTVFDLAHALLGYAETVPERFEGCSILDETTLPQYVELAFGEARQSVGEPSGTAVGIDGAGDDFVRQRSIVGQEIEPL